MNSNRTSSFPADQRSMTSSVLTSVSMTLVTIALTVAAFIKDGGFLAWVLVALSVSQVILLSVNIAAWRHLKAKNQPDAGT